jgi:hypothetical protein
VLGEVEEGHPEETWGFSSSSRSRRQSRGPLPHPVPVPATHIQFLLQGPGGPTTTWSSHSELEGELHTQGGFPDARVSPCFRCWLTVTARRAVV